MVSTGAPARGRHAFSAGPHAEGGGQCGGACSAAAAPGEHVERAYACALYRLTGKVQGALHVCRTLLLFAGHEDRQRTLVRCASVCLCVCCTKERARCRSERVHVSQMSPTRCTFLPFAMLACRFEHILSVELSKGHWLKGVFVVVTCSRPPHKLEVRSSASQSHVTPAFPL